MSGTTKPLRTIKTFFQKKYQTPLYRLYKKKNATLADN